MIKKLKFILLVICFIFSSANISAKDSFQYWSRIMDAISYVESKHNHKARNGSYVGILQIGPAMVKECNNILKQNNESKRFTLNDRLNPKKSKEMFVLFQSKYNPSRSIEKAIRMWNGGPGYSVGKTNRYYNAVMKAYREGN